jgi:hypothetical protein
MTIEDKPRLMKKLRFMCRAFSLAPKKPNKKQDTLSGEILDALIGRAFAGLIQASEKGT